jgi:hypothetical protein
MNLSSILASCLKYLYLLPPLSPAFNPGLQSFAHHESSMPPKTKSAGKSTPAPSRPLFALLSQIIVAYTVEFDNEFERRMSEAGHPGAGLSLMVWHTVMRFLDDNGISVENLETQSIIALSPIKFQLGCLERWRFITLQPDRGFARRSRTGTRRAPAHTRPSRADHRICQGSCERATALPVVGHEPRLRPVRVVAHL